MKLLHTCTRAYIHTLTTRMLSCPQVPFLLKLTLREYQHIGMDWLVTMYKKRLNGILADEVR